MIAHTGTLQRFTGIETPNSTLTRFVRPIPAKYPRFFVLCKKLTLRYSTNISLSATFVFWLAEFWEPMSIQPYMKKVSSYDTWYYFRINNLFLTADNFTCRHATNKLRIYSESWGSPLKYIFLVFYDQTTGTDWKLRISAATVVAERASFS